MPKTRVVPAEEIAAHPTKSLRASDYVKTETKRGQGAKRAKKKTRTSK